jgi:hypothetical protein
VFIFRKLDAKLRLTTASRKLAVIASYRALTSHPREISKNFFAQLNARRFNDHDCDVGFRHIHCSLIPRGHWCLTREDKTISTIGTPASVASSGFEPGYF